MPRKSCEPAHLIFACYKPWLLASEFLFKKLPFNRIQIRLSSVNLYALPLYIFTRKDEMKSTPFDL
jgi:hypothetical protein